MEISPSQDAGHNLKGVPDMAYNKFDPNFELNRFTGSLTYNIRRFIFLCHGSKGGHGPTSPPPP